MWESFTWLVSTFVALKQAELRNCSLVHGYQMAPSYSGSHIQVGRYVP